MYCVIKCIVQGNHARVKNADLRHPSCTVVMYKRKSASSVLNVLIKKCVSFTAVSIMFVHPCACCQVILLGVIR